MWLGDAALETRRQRGGGRRVVDERGVKAREKARLYGMVREKDRLYGMVTSRMGGAGLEAAHQRRRR